jgi:hypothetical protein
MSSTDRNKQPVESFSKAECEYLIAQLDAFHSARWFHRAAINSIPTQGSKEASYDFCGDLQQPAAFNAYLRSLAPKIPGAQLAEACINRYLPGDYMPEHIDIALYRYNMVIALHELGDCVSCTGVRYTDVAGAGWIYPAKSEPHSVPPVRNKRYVVIYLYE